jgi:putative pyruvate formate lyase activating enzyme
MHLKPDKNLLEPLKELKRCSICPRECNADRFDGPFGYCKAGAGFSISSICIHRGEEPAISGDKGICNIFFTNCNLQCVYCKNFQISDNKRDHSADDMPLEMVIAQIIHILNQDIDIVGFVSASHFIPQIKVIINALRSLGYDPAFVYNTNGYDKVESLKSLEDYIDVYLPDYKYAYNKLGADYSDVNDYANIVLPALKEMFRQVGDRLQMDARGYARKGMIIRHLVLPGHPDNSIKVLKNIAYELSPQVHISLMSQYYPTHHVASDPVLGRTLKPTEYNKVVATMKSLGMHHGYVQHLSSYESYRPDFNLDHPFE